MVDGEIVDGKIKLFSRSISLDEKEKNERTFVSMKGIIVHHKKNPRMVTMITINRYMHLWHIFLVMKKVLVDILMTVHNIPIGF